jgi:hypothetical protein
VRFAALGGGTAHATTPPPPDPEPAFAAWAEQQGTPVESIACEIPDRTPIICYGISGNVVVVGQAVQNNDGTIGAFGVNPALTPAAAPRDNDSHHNGTHDPLPRGIPGSG